MIKIPKLFLTSTLSEVREKQFPQPDEGHQQKLSCIILNGEGLVSMFSLKASIPQCPKVPATAIRQEKK